jgi:hypothetical protein
MPPLHAAAVWHCERCAPVVCGLVCVSADNESTGRRPTCHLAAGHSASAVDSILVASRSQSVNRATPSAYVVRGS